jgi:hypothetical protein
MKLLLAAAALLVVVAASSASSSVTANNNNDRQKKASYISKLVSGAIPLNSGGSHRKLGQDADYEVDLTTYFVKFEQCQFVKSYDDNLAMDRDSGTVLATKRFVLFKLCPNECSSCNDGYGEYLIDLEDYLLATVDYFETYNTGMCATCNDECYVADEAEEEDAADADAAAAEGEDAAEGEGDGAGGRRRKQRKRQLNNDNNNQQQNQWKYTVDCTTCLDECSKIANMQGNGYLDATTFLECKMIYDPEDDNKEALYAGPVCVNGGNKIKIGVFSDADCLFLDSNKEVDDYLVDGNENSMKLSHALLKSTYLDTCISCLEPDYVDDDENENADEQNNEDQKGNDKDDGDKVIEMCETLYDESAKCEASHGFMGSGDYDGSENQKSQEDTVCQFMSSLRSGTYDESGEIIVSGSRVSGGTAKASTGGQKFALTFFILGTIGLAGYAAVLHGKLVKGGKAGSAELLSNSGGGAMA